MSSSRMISANGIEIFVTEQGSGPLVLLCHGWPELSHSWRHQLPAIAAAGFHVVAPDMRGFGRTSAPQSTDAYSIFDMAGDMVALVAALGETKAIIIGHDWGAPVAWHAALFRPDIFTAVGGLSVAPPFRGRERPLDALAKSGVTNFYWQYFQKPGVAEAEFERDVDYTMRAITFGVDASLFLKDGHGFLGDTTIPRLLPAWVSGQDHAHVVETYRRTGFRGGLNWYRNIDRNWELTAPWQGAKIHQPSIFIAGANDSVVTGILGGKRVTEMDRVLPNLKRKLIIEGAGHWIQQERPDEVNAALVEFLKGVRG
ncbi:alpha/beta fold hydrolase [Afipia sp. DC4300-2b1]|uniref:alpha/beta fold hydrolase n=1 Tax=Afipia sp. DC4300-2b1 TaxID=2804672 RepID=UPI003CE9B926